MTEQLRQIIYDEIRKLPEETQKAINSIDWVKISNEIGSKYLLSDSDINKLQTEVLLVLINMEYLEDLKLNIESHIDTTKNYSEKMSDELVEKIFNPITKNLNKEVKNNLVYKNIPWNQTINFIVSGGDYSAFIETKEAEEPKRVMQSFINGNSKI